MHEHANSLGPATLQIGSKSVVVKTTPLSATPAAYQNVDLSQPKPEQLVFSPNLGWVPLLLAGSVAIAACDTLLALLAVPGAGLLSYFLWFAALFLALTLGQRFFRVSSFTFNTSERQVRCRLGFHRRNFPQQAILAVQTLPGNIYGGNEGPDCQQYQINLVLHDADTCRLNVSNHSELAWTRESGRRLADFLGVPLVDQC